MFLLPALSALASDVGVLYLNLLGKRQPQQDAQGASVMDDLASMVLPPDSDDPETAEVYFWMGYLGPLAGLRIVLLLLPLLFHSYTGTAVRFSKLYRLLYIGTLGLVILHMLGLAWRNPQSLESLLPWESVFHHSNTTNGSGDEENESTRRHLLQHMHALRRIWFMLLFSAVSNFCHLLILQHVTSTAPETAQPQSVYFAIRSRAASAEEEPALVNAVNEFLVDVQVRMRRTKQEWTQRLDDFTGGNRRSPTGRSSIFGNITINRQNAITSNGPSHNAPFRVLLQLFADQDVISDGQLSAAFDSDGGQSMTTLVPQLLSFLLHGATTCSRDLEDWILQKCSENVYFAHRCYWFLRAWCLEVPGDPTASISGSISVSQIESLSEQEDQSIRPGHSTGFTVIQSGHQQAPGSEKTSGKFMPQERVMIENLMMRIKERGEKAARLLESATRKGGAAPANSGMLPSVLRQVVEQGGVPIDPLTGRPSQRHMDSLATPQLRGFTVPGEPKTIAALDPDSTELFDKTPRFLDALIYMAEWLHTVDRANRKDELFAKLRQLECEMLPDNGVYVPAVPLARVWRVAIQECIPISTKERVPCIIPLELVRWDKPIGDKDVNDNKRWSMKRVSFSIAKLSKNASGNDSAANDGTRQRWMPESSESDIVKDWTTTPRNPQRMVPLINQVAEIVKVTVQERMIDPLQQRTVTASAPPDELTALKSSGNEHTANDIYIDEDNDIFSSVGMIPTDVEAGRLSSMLTSSGPPGMGQWSSSIRKLDRPSIVSGAYGTTQERDDSNLPDNDGSEAAAGSTPSTSRPPPVVFKESWLVKQERIRQTSAYGNHPGWQLFPILIKANDDLRQEELASQLIYRMASILAREKVPVWLCPYEIIALTNRGGIMQAIPDTISIDSLKKNDPDFTTLLDFFHQHFVEGTSELLNAKANFVESLAAYSMVCFLLQIKDRHNGNILLDRTGHVIHIDFGFYFLSSPGKNAGFESAPFKLTRDFVEVMGGPQSHLFHVFRELCVRTFLALRKNCLEILMVVEMLQLGNEHLGCFCGRPAQAIAELRARFRLDLNDQACRDYVQNLIDNSMENWRTAWYDSYQKYFVGVL